MKTFQNPPKSKWDTLCERPNVDSATLSELVRSVFQRIQVQGDIAVRGYTKTFDNVAIEEARVSTSEIATAVQSVSSELKNAIALAASNIEKFHTSQKADVKLIETSKGVNCWRESRPIENVGIYIPGGSAPLFSTVLMLGVPAKIAGCTRIVLCSPPNLHGEIDPAILYTAQLVGITEIYKIGGIQAIATLTLGTETIEKVDKIFGPGNQYVTAAKEFASTKGIAIDMPAGPSEVLIIADESCVPAFVAADLLSQAEHGADSQVVLLSDNLDVLNNVEAELMEQLELLPRMEIAKKALENSRFIFLESIDQCIVFSNRYAPEHLILASENMNKWIPSITNAGSVFIGNYSCESAGDYASGTNHTLPTNGYARNYSGVSLDSFVKKITFQEISAQGIINIGPAIEIMAKAEGLIAHKNAVSLRLNTLRND